MDAVENEIKKLSIRLSIRETEIQTELQKLGSKIRFYTVIAWIFIFLGGINIFLGLIYYFNNQKPENFFNLNYWEIFLLGPLPQRGA